MGQTNRMKINKKNIIFFLLSVLLFSACSQDGWVSEEPKYEEENELTLGFMPFLINFDPESMTRADYEMGNSDKSEVRLRPGSYHFALFYVDGSQTPIIASLEGATTAESDDHFDNYTISYARLWKVEADGDSSDMDFLKEQLEKLKSCIVILNSPLSQDELKIMTKNQLQSELAEHYCIYDEKGVRYFTMVSSTYMKGNAITMEAPVEIEGKIFDNLTDAQEQTLKGNAAVVAYVERLASKFNFEFKNRKDDFIYEADKANERIINVFTGFDENNIPVYDTETFTYKVRLTGWQMNAQEYETYLFKRVQTNGNYFNGWNHEAYHRCYWSEDPDYTAIAYPKQTRQAYDNPSIKYFGHKDVVSLNNFSYNEVSSPDGASSSEIAANFNRQIYTLENTYYRPGLTALYEDRTDILAGTHLLITAELLTNLNDPNKFEANDVYRDEIGNFYKSEKECFKALVEAFNKALESQRTMEFTSVNWSTLGGAVWRPRMKVDLSKAEYALYYGDDRLTNSYIDNELPDNMTFTIEAKTEGGDGKRMIWLDNLSIRNVVTGEAPKVIESVESRPEAETDKNNYRAQELTKEEIKSMMYEWIGPIDHFKDGKMYYAQPVYHSGIGMYGVVRNHSYTFSLTGVNSIGTPVDDPTQVIVPEKVETNDEVEVKVNILGWHRIETEAPILPK